MRRLTMLYIPYIVTNCKITGVSALELATRKHPFASKDMKAQFDLMAKILKQEPPYLAKSDPA